MPPSVTVSDCFQVLKLLFYLFTIGFNDDICGVSYSVRFGAVLITIWNRDGDNDEGKENVKDLILETISPVWTPLASQVYYKKHSEHSGFVAPAASASTTDDAPKV